jgi:hypothetical protein
LKFPDKVVTRFRDLCLALPETRETDAFGHPRPLYWNRVEALIEQSYRQVALKRMLSRLDGKAGAA